MGEDYLQKGNGANEEVRDCRDDEANGHDWQSADVVSQQPARRFMMPWLLFKL